MFARRRRPSLVVAAVLVGAVALAGIASAQRRFRGGAYGRFFREGSYPPQFPPADYQPDGAFTICKLMYQSNGVYEAMGIGWATDYPYAAVNLATRLGELTKTEVSVDKNGEPYRWVVRPTDDFLFKCPIVFASDVGTLMFTPEDAARVREWLLKGGFLWVDDFWGTPAWESWAREIGKALPEYPIVDVPMNHPMLHTIYPVNAIKQVTNIQNWLRTGDTRERGSDSPHADLRMIANDKGRVMVVMTHNTDFGDSWEREAENHEFFLEFSPAGYSLGIDVLVYAMMH